MAYSILLLPAAALAIAQSVKFLISGNKMKFNRAALFSYSGMPSAHSTLVVSLATIIGLELGPASPLFAVAAVLAVIVIRDAVGLRRYLGQHGRVLNILVRDLKEDEMLDHDYPRLLERVGHTPAQAAAGAALGFLVSLTGYAIFA